MHESEVKVKSLSKFEAAAAKLLQLCLTLCYPIDGSPSGSTVPGILQARILEWVSSLKNTFPSLLCRASNHVTQLWPMRWKEELWGKASKRDH